jgi:hypothetical protein
MKDILSRIRWFFLQTAVEIKLSGYNSQYSEAKIWLSRIAERIVI